MLAKDYQDRALAVLREWREELTEQRDKSAEISAALKARGVAENPELRRALDYPALAWAALAGRGKLPTLKDERGNKFSPPYVARANSRGEAVAHACLKIPTGGGKTFLGASALAHMGVGSGLVLWITPSRAIYAQTWAAFKNRDHPYREMLETAAGKRLKLMKKDEPLSRGDVDDRLCVMPLMLQAAAREQNRDFLRMFRDSGRYPSFFPTTDDLSENLATLKEHPDLEAYALTDGGEPGMVKQSLLNVFKVVRPVIVLDEAHNAYSPDRRRQLCEFNPEMILELSATPDWKVSNILADITGEELRREQMIKLPLNVSSPPNIDWKRALAMAKKKRDELEEAAVKLQDQTGRRIRPMMLIRVERTGKDQRGGGFIHAEDAREHLIARLNVNPAHIRRKTAENDEIADEDLLSEMCEVRYILTKNALQEGWDCAFAYVLAMLDSTTKPRALTQMTGRVLRQPGAEWTGVPELDEAYVFCCNRDVGEAADRVKAGLESEGLGDLREFVRAETTGKERGELIVAKRRKKFAKLRAVLPRVLHRRGKKFAPLDYDAHILYEVPWEDIARRPLNLPLGEVEEIDDSIMRVDLPKYDPVSAPDGDGYAPEKKVELEFFVLYLGDVIPNPFVAAEIARNTLDSLREAAGGDDGLFDRRYQIAEAMKKRLEKTVEAEARNVFCRKLQGGEIRFELKAGEGFELPEEEAKAGGGDAALFSVYGRTAEKSLLDPMLSREFNNLERDFAIHLEGVKAVEWWHRFAARRGYALQGWRRRRVYPDFVACVGEGRGRDRRILILETKGLHLSGNPDTEYKRALLDELTATNPRALECGDFTLKTGGRERRMVLRVLLEDGWREEFDKLAAE